MQAIAQSFLNPGQIGVTVLGNMDKFKLVREDLAKLRPGGLQGGRVKIT